MDDSERPGEILKSTRSQKFIQYQAPKSSVHFNAAANGRKSTQLDKHKK
jgi:hypothetical protein